MKQAFKSVATSILVIYVLLIAASFYFFDLKHLTGILSDKRVLSAVGISISAASMATLLAVLIAIPAGYALSRYQFWLKPSIDALLELPMIISPAALGALILILFQTPIGAYFRTHVMDVVYTFSGIVVAQFITILGISTRMIKTVFDEIPARYENIAGTLGAAPWRAFYQISLPLAKGGILSAIVLTWAKAVGEFGATITVAGSMVMKTETLPTAIFMKLSMADIKGTVVLIWILLTVSMVMLIATRLFLPASKND